MPKILYCTSFEISRTREAFVITFRFEGPDGFRDTVYVTISPSGVAALHELLTKEIKGYVKEHGDIPLGNWKIEKAENKNCNGNRQPYLS